jgi:hypothetical protein
MAVNLVSRMMQLLREAGALAMPRPAFKGWLRQISQHDAEVSKEGGFLGVGGVAVSEAEKATLTEISNALKLSA